MNNIVHRLKLYTFNKPWLYNTYYSLLGKKKELHVNKNTDMVIEGYPRSANTFFVTLVRKYLKSNVSIAHHLHNPSQLLAGHSSGVACILLIRKPHDAIVSYVIRNQLSLDQAISEYIKFHEALLPIKEELLVVDFDNLTEDPKSVLSRAVSRWESLFSVTEIAKEIHQESIFNELEQISKANFDQVSETEVARPSTAREPQKKVLIEQLESDKYTGSIVRAAELYNSYYSKNKLS